MTKARDLASIPAGSGDFSVDGDFSLTGGNLEFSNGYGIDFSAAASGTSTSNYYTDYEEGVWTPVLTGSTSGTVDGTGWYVRSGDLCYIHCGFVIGPSSEPIGDYTITGVPFAPRLYGPDSTTLNFGGMARITYVPDNFIEASIQDGTTYIGLYRNRSNNTGLTVTEANFVSSNNMFFRVSGTFLI